MCLHSFCLSYFGSPDTQISRRFPFLFVVNKVVTLRTHFISCILVDFVDCPV